MTCIFGEPCRTRWSLKKDLNWARQISMDLCGARQSSAEIHVSQWTLKKVGRACPNSKSHKKSAANADWGRRSSKGISEARMGSVDIGGAQRISKYIDGDQRGSAELLKIDIPFVCYKIDSWKFGWYQISCKFSHLKRLWNSFKPF